jgi:hypothetical protein
MIAIIIANSAVEPTYINTMMRLLEAFIIGRMYGLGFGFSRLGCGIRSTIVILLPVA